MNSKSSYEDLQGGIRGMKMPAIETWTNEYPDRNYEVSLEIPEVTCICPKTGLPDFAVIHLRYTPDRLCVELKSFKMYIIAYRDIGIFHEHLANRVLDDFVAACRPRQAEIRIEMNPRGGIGTSVTARYPLQQSVKQDKTSREA